MFNKFVKEYFRIFLIKYVRTFVLVIVSDGTVSRIPVFGIITNFLNYTNSKYFSIFKQIRFVKYSILFQSILIQFSLEIFDDRITVYSSRMLQKSRLTHNESHNFLEILVNLIQLQMYRSIVQMARLCHYFHRNVLVD